jgi:DNA polymerase-3 subunit beta
MKLTVNTNKFKDALNLVNRAIANKPIIPILINLKLTASKDNTILLTATDLNQQIEVGCTGKVEETDELTLPAKLLSEIISKIPTTEVTLETIEQRQQVLICAGKGKYHISYDSAEDFPNLSESKPIKPSVKLPALALLCGIQQVCYAAANDESKQIICGVAIKADGHKLELAATDGHRMSVASITTTEQLTTTEITVPIESLITLEKIWTNTKSCVKDIEIYLYDSQVTFTWNSYSITSRILEGKYPNYQLLIPADFQRSIIVNRKDLLNKVEINQVLSNKTRNCLEVNISPENQELTLSSNSEISEGNDTIEATITGDNLDIAFNLDYLIDAIKNTSTKQVQVQLNGALQPVIIKPIEDQHDLQTLEINSLNLIMPVQIH